jgi:NitT/TauT family transport system ATP-binding protein
LRRVERSDFRLPVVINTSKIRVLRRPVESTQYLVIATCAAGHVSGLFITYDLSEAARLAHRIAVLDTRGRGILGQRVLDGAPAERSDEAVFAWVQAALRQDPLFRHIHDVDERQIA